MCLYSSQEDWDPSRGTVKISWIVNWLFASSIHVSFLWSSIKSIKLATIPRALFDWTME